MKRGRDRPALDPENLADRPLVQIGVVAQKDDQALTLAEIAQLDRVRRVRLRHPSFGDLHQGEIRAPLLGHLDGGVHDRPPQPRSQRGLATKAGLPADRTCKALLHRIPGQPLIPDDRERNPIEAPELLSEHSLNLTNKVIAYSHCPRESQKTENAYSHRSQGREQARLRQSCAMFARNESVASD